MGIDIKISKFLKNLCTYHTLKSKIRVIDKFIPTTKYNPKMHYYLL